MGWWTEQVVPRATDVVLRGAFVADLRQRTCAGLAGDVVEIGFGSGLNVPHYPEAVTTVRAVEPSDVAWELAQGRLAASGAVVVRAGLDGQRLDLPDASVDAALSTFSLCTIPDVVAAVRELRRVIRPGGAFHFLEHGVAATGDAPWGTRLTPAWRHLAGGCHLDRPVLDLVGAGGLQVVDVERVDLPAPTVVGTVLLGRAVR